MLTRCPNCETTFRVTAEILRVADGQVRCGRCHTQFDALERLLEENDPTASEPGGSSQPSAARAHTIEVAESDSMEEITLEGKRIEISGTYRVLDPDDSGEPKIRHETVEEWVHVDEIDAVEVEPQVERTESTSHERRAALELAEPSKLHTERASREMPSAIDEPEPIDELLLASNPHARRTTWAWKLLALPLALLLLAQVVHHYRSELARHPRLGAPLMSAYRALGLNLTPDWNLHAYHIKQWGVVMDPVSPGTLNVRASITNGAPFAQPYPLLKLVLEDRWGDQVRAREFEPAEYVDPGTATDRLLAPAQHTNATISIVDPGPDAEGFRFDVCLRGKEGPVCAAEVPAR